jgi:hypothetical protein
MCWCFNFGLSSKKKQQSSSSGEKKRRDGADEPLRGKGRPVVAEVSEKRRSSSTHRRKKSGDSGTTRSSRREKEEHRPRSQQYVDDAPPQRETYRPALDVQVPEMWHRTVETGSTNSSQEALLNPRPQRSSQHQRQRHPKRTSQTTLRGRGAKRDPPRASKSKKNLRPEPSRGWSFFAPSPPKTPKREHRNYQTLDSSPRSHRSSRQHRSPQATSESPRSQNRHRSSRQHEREASSSRQGRSRTPNTAARRVPDRRFAVLAATNQALETVRREAFAQPSPPPRRERLRRYEGVTIPSSQIPFSWDCVSSSQTSAGHGPTAGEPSSRQRRSRR